MDRVRAHVWVTGMVQGVNFRWYTTQYARQCRVGGWVRNLEDGRVEAVFEGKRIDVDQILVWCETGPRHARVTSIDVSWDEEPEGLFEFDVEF